MDTNNCFMRPFCKKKKISQKPLCSISASTPSIPRLPAITGSFCLEASQVSMCAHAFVLCNVSLSASPGVSLHCVSRPYASPPSGSPRQNCQLLRNEN